MIKLRPVIIAFAAAAAVATVVPVFALAAAPVIHENAHFTSEPSSHSKSSGNEGNGPLPAT